MLKAEIIQLTLRKRRVMDATPRVSSRQRRGRRRGFLAFLRPWRPLREAGRGMGFLSGWFHKKWRDYLWQKWRDSLANVDKDSCLGRVTAEFRRSVARWAGASATLLPSQVSAQSRRVSSPAIAGVYAWSCVVRAWFRRPLCRPRKCISSNRSPRSRSRSPVLWQPRLRAGSRYIPLRSLP